MVLEDIAQVIRSKNAGPRTITFDIMFATDADYQSVRDARAITTEAVATLYQIAPEHVRIIDYPLCRAIKIVMPRKITAGDPGDRDVYGAQQHARLLRIKI